MRSRASGLIVVVASIAGAAILAAFPLTQPAMAAFPGSNGKIAFVNRGKSGIYTLQPDGKRLRRLTANGGSPDWSPDGRKIVFAAGSKPHISTMNADGSKVRRLTPGDHMAYDPAWSPDGSKIVFVSGNRSTDLFTMNSDGSDVDKLAGGKGQKIEPAWSPDGSLIAYVKIRKNGTQEIYTMRPDGSHRKVLTRTPNRDEWSPDFSPDGKSIVYDGERIGHRHSRYIYKIRADGSKLRQLTRSKGFGDSSPAFSPNGKKIVFCRAADTDDIYVMRSGGGHKKRLSKHAATGPTWQPR